MRDILALVILSAQLLMYQYVLVHLCGMYTYPQANLDESTAMHMYERLASVIIALEA